MGTWGTMSIGSDGAGLDRFTDWLPPWLTPCGPMVIELLKEALMPGMVNELLKALLDPSGPPEKALLKALLPKGLLEAELIALLWP